MTPTRKPSFLRLRIVCDLDATFEENGLLQGSATICLIYGLASPVSVVGALARASLAVKSQLGVQRRTVLDREPQIHAPRSFRSRHGSTSNNYPPRELVAFRDSQ